MAGCQSDGDAKPGDPFAAAKRRVLTIQPAAPRWERVAKLEGSGEKAVNLEISPRALRWRVRWRCSSGEITLSVAPRPGAGRRLRRASCPKSGNAAWSQTGAVRLAVAAPGGWTAVIEQQLDTPLHEPALPAMHSLGARLLASGRFYPIESPGDGKAFLYRLPSGRLALRLEDFRTSPYPDLVVWVSPARRPPTTEQSVKTPHVQLGALKSTRGNQNYLLPKNLDREAVGSVVIWSTPTQMAYTAAGLRSP